jgi:hypothetical protein
MLAIRAITFSSARFLLSRCPPPALRAMSNEAELAKMATKETGTIFDKIIRKEISADIIYEDAKVK